MLLLRRQWLSVAPVACRDKREGGKEAAPSVAVPQPPAGVWGLPCAQPHAPPALCSAATHRCRSAGQRGWG